LIGWKFQVARQVSDFKQQPLGFNDFLGLDVPPREMLLKPILPARSPAMLYVPRGVARRS